MRALFREGLFQISAWPQWHSSGITNFYFNRLKIHTLPAFSYSPNLDTSFFIVEEAKPEKYKWQFYFGLPNRKTRASVESRGVARWFKTNAAFKISLRSLVKYFATLEKKFLISVRPCNILYIQLFRERLSEKVHATIPKGILGGFKFTVL